MGQALAQVRIRNPDAPVTQLRSDGQACAGIVATITKVKEGSDEIEAEIAPNVKVMLVRGTITSVLRPQVANDQGAAAKTG